jgi:hypothetical protein
MYLLEQKTSETLMRNIQHVSVERYALPSDYLPFIVSPLTVCCIFYSCCFVSLIITVGVRIAQSV